MFLYEFWHFASSPEILIGPFQRYLRDRSYKHQRAANTQSLEAFP